MINKKYSSAKTETICSVLRTAQCSYNEITSLFTKHALSNFNYEMPLQHSKSNCNSN